MAITTDDGKLAIMEMDVIWEPAVPWNATEPFTQGEKQHLIWGFPEILWGEPPVVSEMQWDRIALTIGLGI